MRDYHNHCYDANSVWFRGRPNSKSTRFISFDGVGATQSTSSPTNYSGTSGGAQSPVTVGSNVTSGAPILNLTLKGSTLKYTPNPDNTAALAAISTVGQALADNTKAISNLAAGSSNTGSDALTQTIGALAQVLGRDQTIAASTASGGQTDTNSTVMKIVYAMGAVLIAVVLLPIMFGRKS